MFLWDVVRTSALMATLSAEPDSSSVVQGLFGVLGSRSHLTATSPIQGGASELTISEKEVLPADPEETEEVRGGGVHLCATPFRNGCPVEATRMSHVNVGACFSCLERTAP